MYVFPSKFAFIVFFQVRFTVPPGYTAGQYIQVQGNTGAAAIRVPCCTLKKGVAANAVATTHDPRNYAGQRYRENDRNAYNDGTTTGGVFIFAGGDWGGDSGYYGDNNGES